ncbi:MAG: hypothetical protein ACI9VR_004243 [Cognaticolwellia sp.]|jgi:hypothetical protein
MAEVRRHFGLRCGQFMRRVDLKHSQYAPSCPGCPLRVIEAALAKSTLRRIFMGLVVSGAVPPSRGGRPDRHAGGHPPADPAGRIHADELLVWSPKPGERLMFGVPQRTTINTLGTRNPKVTPKAEDELRLLTLGDSTVLGVLVSDDQVFSSVAARYLR